MSLTYIGTTTLLFDRVRIDYNSKVNDSQRPKQWADNPCSSWHTDYASPFPQYCGLNVLILLLHNNIKRYERERGGGRDGEGQINMHTYIYTYRQAN